MVPSGAPARLPPERIARPLAIALLGGWVLIVALAAWQHEQDRAAARAGAAATAPPAAPPDGLRRGAGR